MSQNKHVRFDQPKLTLASLRSDLQASIDKAFDPHPTAYKKVVFQFLHFHNNDIQGVEALERQLGTFLQTAYGFDIRYKEIGKHPVFNVGMEVTDLLNDLGKECGKGCLLVLVYSGHGKVETHQGYKKLRVG